MPTLVLTHRDVRSLLTMELAVDAIEAAFAAHGAGTAQMPSKVYLSLPQHHGDFRAMPAYLDGTAGVKWVNSHPDNPRRHGLPSVIGTYILSDPATALPLAVLDATWLTAVRTGAAGAVAARHLAKGRPATVGFVGCGVQARTLHAALGVVYGEYAVIAADLDPARAASFATEVGGQVGTIEQAAGADIVCTATPSRRPVLERGWIRPGTHINAMGADAPGKQELDPAILRDARVVVDDLDQASHSGEINLALHDGSFLPTAIYGTLGEIVAGHKPGRGDAAITVFDSTGLAIQDVALARAVLDTARQRGVGLEVDLTGH